MSTSFHLILDDTSPVVNYFPFAETQGVSDLLAGWNSYFTQSGFLTQLGETALGDSYHVTGRDGAALTIPWFGTGISLFGNVVDAAYQVSLDGSAPLFGLPRQDILFEFQGLESKQHSILLMVYFNATSAASSFLAFDRAALNVSTGLNGVDISSELLDFTSSCWIFSGEWSEPDDLSLTAKFHAPYRISQTRGSTASITFTGSAVSLTGIRNDTHGHYNVTLDGKTTMFDGHSDWLLEDSTLFLQAGLNETMQHTLTVTNADDASFALTGINITHVTGGTPAIAVTNHSSTGISVSTIIGLTFAAVFGVLVIATIILCVYFRQRRRHNHNLPVDMGGISSSDFFRDFGAKWSSMRRRSTFVSRIGDNAMQGLYSTPPHVVGDTITTEKNSRPRSHVVLVASRNKESIHPSSPLPHQRPSRTSTAANAPSPGGRRRSQSETAREARMENLTLGLLEAYSHPESGNIDMSEPSPVITRSLNLHSPRQSTVMQPPRRPRRIKIPQENALDDTSAPQRAWRGPLLLVTPVRGARRSTQRNSDTPSHEMALPSVSTIRFSRPWEERRDSRSVAPGATTGTVEGETPPSSPLPYAEPVHDHRSRKPLLGLFNWKAPW